MALISPSKLLSTSLVAGLLLAGCASQSVYAPADKLGAQGYTETKLSDNRYRVNFTGNSLTPASTVKDYALLRAAELTLQTGNDWFQTVDRDTDKKVRANTSYTGVDYPPQTTVYQNCGVLGCRTTVATTPSFGGGIDTGVTTTSTEYSTTLEIVTGKNPSPKTAQTYDARDVATRLRQNLADNAAKKK